MIINFVMRLAEVDFLLQMIMFFLLRLSVYVCVHARTHAHTHVHGNSAHGVQRRALDSLELELQGIEFKPSIGAVHAFNPHVFPPQTPWCSSEISI